MEITELSLAPNRSFHSSSSSSNGKAVGEFNVASKKRKHFSEQYLVNAGSQSLDLQLKDPLPFDWEQCLDLESGKMYYLNRKTLKRTCNLPKDQKLDLELNISAHGNCSDQLQCSGSSNNSIVSVKESNKKLEYSSGSNMVALACLNCHLLVILSKSSPSCPNCKFVHSLPTLQSQPQPPKLPTIKSLNTLSLLN